MQPRIWFLSGFVFSLGLTCLFLRTIRVPYYEPEETTNANYRVTESYKEEYDNTVADKLYDQVKILCWVMTTPANHKTKALHVKRTWGKYCNKLLFVSSQTDVDLGAVALPVNQGRNFLWGKTRIAFHYIYNHHFNDADWFVKADDDS